MLTLKQELRQRFSLSQEGGVGQAYVEEFPEVSELGIINGVWLPESERNKGIGDTQHKERLRLMKERGFLYALCTVSKWNEAELHIMEKNGWEKLKEMEFNSLWFKVL